RPQPAEDLAAQALDRGRREDALGGAADAPQKVDAGALVDRQERRLDIAVGDEADAGPRRADLPHLLFVAGPVEDGEGDVFGAAPLALADGADDLGERTVEADQVGEARPGRQLLHVYAGAR